MRLPIFGPVGSSSLDRLIRHESQYALYEQGDAEILCGSNLYNSRVLYFRKQGKSLFARTDNFPQHKVNISLTEPDDFILMLKIIFTLCIIAVLHPIADGFVFGSIELYHAPKRLKPQMLKILFDELNNREKDL